MFLELQELQVQMVLQEQAEQQGLVEFLVHLVLLVLRELQELMVLQGLLVLQEQVQ